MIVVKFNPPPQLTKIRAQNLDKNLQNPSWSLQFWLVKVTTIKWCDVSRVHESQVYSHKAKQQYTTFFMSQETLGVSYKPEEMLGVGTFISHPYPFLPTFYTRAVHQISFGRILFHLWTSGAGNLLPQPCSQHSGLVGVVVLLLRPQGCFPTAVRMKGWTWGDFPLFFSHVHRKKWEGIE